VSELGPLIATGRTSEVFEYGAGSVIKLLRPSTPKGWAQTEADHTSAARAAGAPAPEVFEVVEVTGRPGIVFERIEGLSLWEAMQAEPDTAADLVGELTAVHQRVLRLGLPPGLPDSIERMQAKITMAPELSDDISAEAVALADSLPRGAAMLHGDLHPGNVLMSPDGPVIIDWFDAAIGHPVADVVRSSILLRPPTPGVGVVHLPGADAALLHLMHARYIDEFPDLLSNQADHLAHWEAVVGLSRLAEHAQRDESALWELWRRRELSGPSPLLAAATDARLSSSADRTGSAQ